MSRDLVGTNIPVIGRVFRNTKMKIGFEENLDTPSFTFDPTYENNESWKPADMSREAELAALRKSGVRLSAESTPLPESFSKAAKFLKQLTRRRRDASRGKVKFKRLTFEQVLMKLHWGTSPGWKWTNQGYKTKGDVIADPKMLQFLRDVYDEKIEVDPVFTGSLKTELRPESRVNDKKTRMFQIAPIEHHILLYKYFGDFLDWFVTQFQDMTPLGTSPFAGNWDEMIRDLKTHPFGYSLDGSCYDYWINEQFYALCNDYLDEFHDLSDVVRRMFANTAFAPFIDSLGNVIPTAGTNKSGWLLTLFLNTFVIIISLLALWIEMYGDSADSMKTFEKHVKFRSVGDDNIFTASEEAHPTFNGDNYVKFMAPWIPFEPAYEKALPAEEMSFLSKKTAFDEKYHKYVPTWAYARVYSTALYDKIKKGGSGLFDRCMKLFNLRILSFYDKQAYKQLDGYCAEILYALEKRFRGSSDYQLIYDLYWTEDEIRAFFCEKRPLRSVPYILNDFYLSFEAANEIPPSEVNFAQTRDCVPIQATAPVRNYFEILCNMFYYDRVGTEHHTVKIQDASIGFVFQQTYNPHEHIHAAHSLALTKREELAPVRTQFEILNFVYIPLNNASIRLVRLWDMSIGFVFQQRFNPHVHTSMFIPNIAQSREILPTLVDTKEIAMRARKFVTVVLPLQPSNSQTGLLRAIQSRPTSHRACMSASKNAASLNKAKARIESAVNAELNKSFGKPQGKGKGPKQSGKSKQSAQRKAGSEARKPAARSKGPALTKPLADFVRKEAATARVVNVAAKDFARAQLNPLGSQPQASPLFGNKPSGVCKVHETGSVQFSGQAEAQFGKYHLHDTNSLMLLRRDVRRLKLEYKFITSSTNYNWLFPNAANSMTSNMDTSILQNDDLLCPVGAIYTGGDPIHGDLLVAGNTTSGAMAGFTGILMQKSDSQGEAYWQFEGLVASQLAIPIKVWYYYNAAWRHISTTIDSDALGHADLSVPAGCPLLAHYTFSFDDVTKVGPTLTITQTLSPDFGLPATTTSVFGQTVCPEFLEHRVNWDSVCVTALDALLSNRTETVSLNGSVFGIQVSGLKDINEFLPIAPSTQLSTLLSPVKDYFDSPAAKGIHAPVLAADTKAFQEMDTSGCLDANSPIPAYDLEDKTEFVIAAFEMDASTTFGNAQVHSVVCAHLNFKSESQVYNYVTPSISIPDVEDVIQLIASSDFQFTENKNHWGMIKGWIKGALKVGGSIAQTIAPAFAEYGPIISAAGRIASTGSMLM